MSIFDDPRQEWMHLQALIADMTDPVRCRCGTVYDKERQPIVDSHFIDCTTWRCPGCKVLVDDRQDYFPMGSGVRHYERLEKREGPWQRLVEMGY